MPKFRRVVLITACLLLALPAVGARGRSADTPPAGEAAQAIAYANSQYREPLGLPDISWNTLIAKAAANHAHYLALNGYNTSNAHQETPGKPGFTGAGPGDRCAAVGAPSLCGEVAYENLDLTASVAGWLNTPYHGLPFFDPPWVCWRLG